MLKGSGDFSPKDPDECPESCPHASEDLDPESCPRERCIYGKPDPDDLGDYLYHRQF